MVVFPPPRRQRRARPENVTQGTARRQIALAGRGADDLPGDDLARPAAPDAYLQIVAGSDADSELRLGHDDHQLPPVATRLILLIDTLSDPQVGEVPGEAVGAQRVTVAELLGTEPGR